MNLLTRGHLLVPGRPHTDRADRSMPSTAAPTSLRLLTSAFVIFNAMRLLSYLPTLWTIPVQGDACPHSLLTWLTWTGANATMAAWVFEHNGHRMNPAIVVSACNAALCAATSALILAYRL